MTQQEQQMLQGLADNVNKTQLTDKDPEAEQFLQTTLGKNSDALYILAQTVLVTQYALEQAQRQMADARTQIGELQQQLQQTQQQQPQKHTSFLGGLLGGHDDRPAPPPPVQQQQQPQYQPVQNYQQPQYAGQPYPVAPPQYGSPVYVDQGYAGPMSGQQGGFLRGALQTATGVAAGAVAFEGIESLMHGFGGGGYGYERGGGYGFGGGGGFNQPTEVINNYYDDNRGGGGGGDFSQRLSSDIEDRRDDGQSQRAGDFAGNDAGSQFANDFGGNDASSNDTTSSDFDDSGSGSDMGSDAGSDFGSDNS